MRIIQTSSPIKPSSHSSNKAIAIELMYLVNSSDECNYFIFINGSRCIGHRLKLELSCLGHFPNSLATSSLKLKHTVCLISVQIIAAHDEDLSLVQRAGD